MRTRPWCSSGCAFAHALPPVVEAIARVADCVLAAQRRETALVEDLRHETEVAYRREPAILTDSDSG